MSRIGRNSPCPCGSGKKYKKCCLQTQRGAEGPSAADRAHAGATEIVLRWIYERYAEPFEQALVEDMYYFDDEAHAEAFEALSEGHREMIERNGREIVLAEDELDRGDGLAIGWLDLVLGPGGPLLDAEARRYLESLREATMGVYEIVSVQPGKGFTLKSLLDPDEPEHWIKERLGSQSVRPGEVLGARIVVGNKVSAMYIIPGAQVPRLLSKLRELIDSLHSPGGRRIAISAVIWRTWFNIFFAPPPQLVDAATGEPFVMVTDHYRVLDQEKLDSRLLAQDDVEQDDEAVYSRLESSTGTMRRVLLTLEPGKAHDRVEAFARSVALADAGREWLREVAGDALEYITRELSDPVQAIKGRAKAAAKDDDGSPGPIQLTEGVFQEVYENIYRDWAKIPIPALGNVSPAEAMATPAGRKAVVELIEMYEREDKVQANTQGRPPVSFRFLRDSVGL